MQGFAKQAKDSAEDFIGMLPTNKLRFIKKRRSASMKGIGPGDHMYGDEFVLQQWWESDGSGEWRDVPMDIDGNQSNAAK